MNLSTSFQCPLPLYKRSKLWTYQPLQVRQSWTKPVNKTRRYVHFCSIFINTCASRHIGPLSPRNNVALMGLYCGDDESNIEWGKGGQNVEYNLVNAISL